MAERYSAMLVFENCLSWIKKISSFFYKFFCSMTLFIFVIFVVESLSYNTLFACSFFLRFIVCLLKSLKSDALKSFPLFLSGGKINYF